MAFTERFEYDQNDSSLPGLDENQAIHIIDRIEAIAGLRNSISTLNDIKDLFLIEYFFKRDSDNESSYIGRWLGYTNQ